LIVSVMLCASCKRENGRSQPALEVGERQRRALQEAERIIGELSRGDYDRIYSRLAPRLSKEWVKETFASNMSELRKRIGKEWSPKRRGYSFSFFTRKKCEVTYNLTSDWISEHSVTFSLVEANGAYAITDLEARILYLKNSEEASGLTQACDRFLSLLAEGKVEEARRMCVKRARGLVARPQLKKIGRI